ncbi:hypothetical protein [Streptomyces sp. 900116325]
MPPGQFWDMTQVQLVTLADQHQAAHNSGGSQSPNQSGPSLLAMAAMQ